MTPSRIAHVVAAIAAGLALAASIYGSQRLATALLVLTVLIHAASLETLRVLAARQEKRP